MCGKLWMKHGGRALLAASAILLAAGAPGCKRAALAHQASPPSVWRASPPRSALPEMAAPTRSDRLLILAPNCDDETLACGGLIARAVKAGAAVQVVIATAGDGFRHAVEQFFGERPVSRQRYLMMAVERQGESLAALSLLGLSPGKVIFLGYPDGSSGPMWQRCWYPSQLYTSPHTGASRNPYPQALRPGAPYCGRALTDDLKTVIRRFKPSVVFCPHPNDAHPDHWSLYCYTLAALHELGMLDRVPLRLYLVHRGDFPPRGLHLSDPIAPPTALAHLGTRWESLPLDPALAEQKRRAILCYRSQVLVMRRFMVSFAGSSELFGRCPVVRRLPRVEPGRIRVDGSPSDWGKITPIVTDPAQDLAVVGLNPAVDLVGLYAAWDGRRLFVRLDLWRPASPDLEYAVELHPLWARKVGPPLSYAVRPGRPSPGLRFQAGGRCLEMSLPWPQGAQGILLRADSRLGSRVLDETAWVLLRVSR
jgi:LmbE family N-acetylglucosaminyl deacetylase